MGEINDTNDSGILPLSLLLDKSSVFNTNPCSNPEGVQLTSSMDVIKCCGKSICFNLGWMDSYISWATVSAPPESS